MMESNMAARLKMSSAGSGAVSDFIWNRNKNTLNYLELSKTNHKETSKNLEEKN